MPEKILIVGATGYIAARLIPLLLEDGHTVRCFARDPKKLVRRSWYDQVEIIQADVNQQQTMLGNMEGITTAYYLVHNMSAGKNYHQLDMRAATNFAAEAKSAGVKRIVYLGGLADPAENGLAQHLASRIQTGFRLRQAGIPVIEFRVGVVVGAGSVSFEMIRYIAEQFPLLVGPSWLRHKTQPVSVIDVLQYLRSAPSVPTVKSITVDIGSKQTQTYIEIMIGYARIRKLKRHPFLLPWIPVEWMAFFIDKLSPVQYSYALPLVEGLKNDSLTQFTEHHYMFKTIQIMEYEQAVKLALEETVLGFVERTWLDSGTANVSCFHSGLAIQFDRISISNSPMIVMEKIHQLAKMDIRPLNKLSLEIELDSLDRYRLTGELKGRGKVWVEWLVMPTAHGCVVEQTAAIRPEGTMAFLYLYLNRTLLKAQLISMLNELMAG